MTRIDAFGLSHWASSSVYRRNYLVCYWTVFVIEIVIFNVLQLAVEMKQGISQLELLFQEFSREDRLKQRRKQVRKLKKRRKKARKNAAVASDSLPGTDTLFADDDDEVRALEFIGATATIRGARMMPNACDDLLCRKRRPRIRMIRRTIARKTTKKRSSNV